MMFLAQATYFLASAELPVPGRPAGKISALVLRDVVLIIILAAAILLVLILWAKYLRKTKGRNKGKLPAEKVYRASAGAGKDSEEEEELKEDAPREMRRRYKVRYRRRQHRSRNPTLAETGGLPPSKDGGVPGAGAA